MYSIATTNSTKEPEIEVKDLMKAEWRPVGGLVVEPHPCIEGGTTRYNRTKFYQSLMNTEVMMWRLQPLL